MLGESSMNSGASDTRPIVDANRVQSSSRIVPLRMCCSWMPASAESSRMVISVLLISSEKTTERQVVLDRRRPDDVESERRLSRSPV